MGEDTLWMLWDKWFLSELDLLQLRRCWGGDGLGGESWLEKGLPSPAPKEPSISSDGVPHGQVCGKLFDTIYVSGHRCEAAGGQQCEQWEELEMEQKGARTRSILHGTCAYFCHRVWLQHLSEGNGHCFTLPCEPYTSFFQLTATGGEDLGVIEFQLNWVNTMRTITVRFLLLVVWLSGIHSWRHVWSHKR